MATELGKGVYADDGENITNRKLIVELAETNRLPPIYELKLLIEAGGLMKRLHGRATLADGAALRLPLPHTLPTRTGPLRNRGALMEGLFEALEANPRINDDQSGQLKCATAP